MILGAITTYDKCETWLTVYCLLEETHEHVMSRTNINWSDRDRHIYAHIATYTYMCISVCICTHTWKGRGFSRQMRSKSVQCVQRFYAHIGLIQWFPKYGPKPSLGVLPGQNYLQLCDICTDGAKTVVGKIAGASASNKAVLSDCDSRNCNLHHHTLTV